MNLRLPWIALLGALLAAPFAPSARAQSTINSFAGLAGVSGSVDAGGTAARFNAPSGVAVDGSGNVYVVESANNTVRKITALADVSTLAGLAGVAGSTDSTNTAARFKTPGGVAVDTSGNVYVADYGNHTIRKIAPDGTVTTLAGLAGSPGTADGTGNAARFSSPGGVAVDNSGNVYVADTANCAIRKITSGGVVTTLAGTAGTFGSADGTGTAARFFLPFGIAVDSSGNVYVADTQNCTLRKITSSGAVTTLAGSAGVAGNADGTGAAAQFRSPKGVAVDSTGSLFVADSGNDVIRKVSSAGVVVTLAGTAGVKGSTDGDGATARFRGPVGVAVDIAGNIYIADSGNHTIRQGLKPGAPSITAQPIGQTIVPGGTVNFTVTATGGGTLYYQWRKDGTNLTGQTGVTLTLFNAATNEAGAYTVAVSNTTATVVSSAAQLAFYSNFTNTVLAGIARDALTGQPRANVTISIAGTNRVSGVDGSFFFNAVPAVLPVTLIATASGYSSFSASLNLLVGITNQYEFAISPNIGDPNTIRLVLTWGASPTDLDSHLLTPAVAGQFYHIYFSDRGTVAGPPFANLDVDDVTSYGPETITITNTSPGTYTYYVYQYSSVGSIVGSGAAARIYTAAGLASTLTVPATGVGRYWYVCQIDGLTKAVTLLNYVSNSPPSLPTGPAAITTQPQSRVTTAGSNVSFAVVAAGSGPLYYQWMRDGTNIADATNSLIALPFVSRAIAGTFSVLVTNASGAELSAGALLRVLGPTQISPVPPLPGAPFRLRFTDVGSYPLDSQFASGFQVQVNTNLLTTNWVALTNAFQITNGGIEVDDTAAAQHPHRFYRVIER
ncbi:MAG: immunoglobulin domain-containing protein [Limisphaerales bacterium]